MRETATLKPARSCAGSQKTVDFHYPGYWLTAGDVK